MQDRFKSALDRIEADQDLVSRTERQLRTAPAQGHPARAKLKVGRFSELKKFALVACLALLLAGGGYAYAIPTAYLSVDINPSVELGINTLGKVLSVKAYNDDGAAILNGLDLQGMKVKQAVSLIVDAAEDKGYFEEDGSSIVLLTATTDNRQRAGELTADAAAGAKTALTANETAAEVSQAAISEARRDTALEVAGISPGKMNLLEKLWEATNGAAATAGDFNEILSLADATLGENEKTSADYKVQDIMAAIKAARTGEKLKVKAAGYAGKPAKGKVGVPGQPSPKDQPDADKSGKDKASAPGQQQKAHKDKVNNNNSTQSNTKSNKNVTEQTSD